MRSEVFRKLAMIAGFIVVSTGSVFILGCGSGPAKPQWTFGNANAPTDATLLPASFTAEYNLNQPPQIWMSDDLQPGKAPTQLSGQPPKSGFLYLALAAKSSGQYQILSASDVALLTSSQLTIQLCPQWTYTVDGTDGTSNDGQSTISAVFGQKVAISFPSGADSIHPITSVVTIAASDGSKLAYSQQIYK